MVALSAKWPRKCSHVNGEGLVVHSCAMYIESVPNRNSPPAILLRESYRDAGKIKKREGFAARVEQWGRLFGEKAIPTLSNAASSSSFRLKRTRAFRHSEMTMVSTQAS